MPSPSKFHLFTGLLISSGIIFGGAYIASALSTDSAGTTSLELKEAVMPAIIPNIVEPQTRPTQIAEAVNVEPAPDPTPPARKSLKVTVSGISHAQGNIIILVFNDAKAYAAYDYTQAVGYKEIPAQEGALSVTFPELTDGPYIITSFHDENGDQDFNLRNGYPVEGYGTSGAKDPYDDVTFKQGAVMAGDVTVKMYYLE